MFANRTVTELLDNFSSPDPTPGGGSASALAGALGASLLAMVAALPKTRTNAPAERSTLDDTRRALLNLRGALVQLIDRDAAAYDQVVLAYKLPKATDDEKASRKAAIAAALKLATEIPLLTMRTCAAVLELGKTVAEHGNLSAASDIGVGLHLAMTGLSGARLNVDTNLASASDQAYAASKREELLLLMVGAGADLQAASRAAGLVKVPGVDQVGS
jgi:formiminotetrahydrofolate cyclodeaminase